MFLDVIGLRPGRRIGFAYPRLLFHSPPHATASRRRLLRCKGARRAQYPNSAKLSICAADNTSPVTGRPRS
jgi:hypothetical protein